MEQLDNNQKERTQADYLNMTHSVALNHLRTELKKSKHKSRVNKITDYLINRIWAWLYYYIDSRFGRNYPYQTYQGGETGIYQLGDGPATIALTADWATNTPESVQVAACMGDNNPDYTIHLGDTYYVGAPPEILQNFVTPGSPWVRGSKGSFALLGNHEMYARGVAFFKDLLPSLGIRNAAGVCDGQKAGFFCLENKYWRILGLDTGYHSIGKVPVLELLPWFAPDCHFDKMLVTWLKEIVKLDDKNDKRGLLILTHHQYITAFKSEGEYPVPAKQLAELIGTERPVLWLWGHEHKFSVFEKAQVAGGITAYGRCIGHGGMPVELQSDEFMLNPKTSGYSKLVMVDERERVNLPGCRLGFNGYVMLNVDDDKLEIAYHDVNGKILAENWVADITAGTIQGTITGSSFPGLQPVPGKLWHHAVK